MMLDPRKTHVLPTLMLFAAALLPLLLPATIGAYGDAETSVGNIMQASTDFDQRLSVEVEPFALRAAVPEEGDVAGTTTEQTAEDTASTTPKVEVSDEPLEIVETGTSTPEVPEPKEVSEPEVQVSDEPLEVVEPKDEPIEEPAPDEEPEPEPEPEPEIEEAPADDPAPAPAE